MRLTFIAIETGKEGCPTLYSTDHDSFVVQGWRVADPAAVAGLTLGSGESCVEVPHRLLTHLPKPEHDHSAAPAYVATERGTFVVKGPEILDEETLGQMDVPGHETAVHVSKEALAELARTIT